MTRITQLLQGLGTHGATENARAELVLVHNIELQAAVVARRIGRVGAEVPLAAPADARVA